MSISHHGPRDHRLIETNAIIVAYGMSRFDVRFLRAFQFASWRQAFAATGSMLGVPASSMKNLRDEFDPVHPNGRRGWHQRPLRPNRQRVLAEFCEVSDDAVIEIIRRLLARDEEVISEVAKPLAWGRERVENVAERLRTGRLAEEYFMEHSGSVCGVPPSDLIDRRNDAVGFDFSVSSHSEVAIEVKGMKRGSGDILFTDMEWRQASDRLECYWLVVVGGIANKPIVRLFKSPVSSIIVKSQISRTTTISWRARVTVS